MNYISFVRIIPRGSFGSSANRFGRGSRVRAALLAAAVLTYPAATAGAQTSAPTPPQIVVSAIGEVKTIPDKANLQLGVETQAKTAAAAAAENSRKQTAIIAAVKAAGVAASAITTTSFTVNPIQRWNETTKRTVIDGYQVTNIVAIDVAKIELTGAVIDGALAAGANRVAGLSFELSDPSKARDEALTKAVAQAKRDAEVAARAAGGAVSDLLEIVVNHYEQPRPMMMMSRMDAAQAAPTTPISEGTVTIQVSVTTRWTYSKAR